MAANMGSTCPADPIWYRRARTMTVTCTGCGRSASKSVEAWAQAGGFGQDARIWQVLEKVKCSGCGARNPKADVK
jgi:ribosomal protein S27E